MFLESARRRELPRCRHVLHVLGFDGSRIPPVYDTVTVCRDAGIESSVVVSVAMREHELFGDAELIMPDRPASGLDQQRFLLSRAPREARRRRPDVVIAHNPRGAAAGVASAIAARCPMVYYSTDLDGTTGVRGRVLVELERLAGSVAVELWICSVERETVVRRAGVKAPSIIVRNCPRRLHQLPAKGTLRPWLQSRGSHMASDRRLVVRHGMIGPAHCVLETIEAVARLGADVDLVILGTGAADYIEACRDRARRLGMQDRFHIHPFGSHADVPALLIDADVAVCIYAPLDLNTAVPAGPIKVYDSMAVGVPVIVSDGSSFADEVVDAGAGVAVTVGANGASVPELTSALARMLAEREQIGRRGRLAHLTRFNFEHDLGGTLLGPFVKEVTGRERCMTS